MKKRLFLSSAIMTGVLAVALSTGTYAWYQSSTTGSKAALASATTKDVNTKATGGAAIGELYASYTLTWTEDPTYTAASAHLVDENGVEWVWVNGTKTQADTNENLHPYAAMSVKVSSVNLFTDKAMETEANDAQKAAAAGEYNLYVHDNSDRVHIMAEAPDAAGEYVNTKDVTIKLTFQIEATADSEGKVTLSVTHTAVKFYYTFDGYQGEKAGEETYAKADASDTGISVTFSVTEAA
jgi:hypothetical protein